MVAYLAEGKLYLLTDGQQPKLVDSPFVQQMVERQERDRQRHGWKSQGMGWSFNSRQMNPMMLAAMQEGARPVQFTGLARSGEGRQIIYSINTSTVGELFEHDLSDGSERRMFHRADFKVVDLARHEDGTLAMSLRSDDGSAHIGTMPPGGRGVREITEGDSIDEAPRWVPGSGKAIIFQSAGVGRNPVGLATAYGPYAIQKLDLDKGEFITVIEDEAHDYLCPHLSSDGTLHYIRRSYQPHGQPVSPWRVAMDIVLFPFRLARALVHFLNVFSLFFSKKPLLTAGGPKREGPDARFMMLWGRYINAEKMAREGADPAAGMVPKDWQLIRRSPAGQEEVLANGVLSFDVGNDGGIVYTNGLTIYRRTASGELTEIGGAKFIERICIV